MSKLSTFNRNNEWWLWVCLNAPLTHVRGIALEFDSMERTLKNQKHELDSKAELISNMDATLKSQNKHLARTLERREEALKGADEMVECLKVDVSMREQERDNYREIADERGESEADIQITQATDGIVLPGYESSFIRYQKLHERCHFLRLTKTT